jgi:putative NADH-flavin reductase
MTTVAIFGATGYSGGNIAAEALSRGHRVIAVARNTGPLAGDTDLDVRQGSLFDKQFVREIAAEADVIVVAL